MNHIQSKLRGHPLANFLLNDFYLDKTLDFYFLFEGLYSTSKQSKCVHKRTITRRFGLNFLLEEEIKLKRLFKSGVLTRHFSFGRMEIQFEELLINTN